jgi:hypothetical protein
MIRLWSALALSVCALVMATPAAAQLSVSRSPTGTAPVIGTVVRGSAATTFSISTSGVITRTAGNAIRLSTASVTAPTISIACGFTLFTCQTRDVRVVITASGASDDGSINRFRMGALTGGSYRNSAPGEGASLTFDLRPIGSGRTVSFPLGMDVLLTAGADSGTDTFTYTVTATFL